MHEEDPEGFSFRSPAAKKIQRFPKYPIGINERWAGDGHDKLNRIGIAKWAVVDEATSKWLGAWAVPNNRLGAVVSHSSHSGHWGVFRGGICREYVPTRLNIPTLIQLRKLLDYSMKSSMEYVLYIYRIMYDIQIDFPPGIII